LTYGIFERGNHQKTELLTEGLRKIIQFAQTHGVADGPQHEQAV